MVRTRAAADRLGLPLTTRSALAAEHYLTGVDRFLSLNAGADESFSLAIEQDDTFALPLAALAILLRSQGEVAQARDMLRRGLALRAGLSRRERQHLDVVDAYVGNDARRAFALMREHLAEFPTDALILSQLPFTAHAETVDRRRLMLALVEHLAPSYGDDWWFSGFSSMWYQEVDQFEQARRLAARSLQRFPRNASAAHPMAHVFYETNDHLSGVSFLDDWLAKYDREAPYHSHLSWHLALSELASAHYDRVMEVYDSAISPAVARTRLSLFDAASLLWRLEVYGCATGPLPWGAVRDLGVRLFPRAVMPFADAMMALACSGARDDVALGRLVDGLRAQAANGNPAAATVVLPIVEGVAAFSRAEYDTAARALEPLADEIVRIGGTNAQREVFQDTLVEAYLRAGPFDDAEALLRKRLSRRSSARDLIWLQRAQVGGKRADGAGPGT